MINPKKTHRCTVKKLPNGKYSFMRLDLSRPDGGWEFTPDMTIAELLAFGQQHHFGPNDLDLIQRLPEER